MFKKSAWKSVQLRWHIHILQLVINIYGQFSSRKQTTDKITWTYGKNEIVIEHVTYNFEGTHCANSTILDESDVSPRIVTLLPRLGGPNTSNGFSWSDIKKLYVVQPSERSLQNSTVIWSRNQPPLYNSQVNYNIHRSMQPDSWTESWTESGCIQPAALKPIFLRSYLTLPIHLWQESQESSAHHVFQLKFCINFSSIPCTLSILPTASSIM